MGRNQMEMQKSIADALRMFRTQDMRKFYVGRNRSNSGYKTKKIKVDAKIE